jgi:hypothetical protein
MGTRSLTKIYDGNMLLVTIYGQQDGYMAGHGKLLAGILEGKTMVNGYSKDVMVFNGPGCMAATIIAGLKKGVGNYYIYAPGATDEDDVSYVYTIRSVNYAEPTIKVTSRAAGTMFDGDATAFVEAVLQRQEY